MKRTEIIDYCKSLTGESGHTTVLQIYNSQKKLPRGYAVRLNDAWCATFVSAVFLKFGYSDISECSCLEMGKKAANLGIFKKPTYNADLGDIIFYDWNGDNVFDHVGIIVGKTDTAYIVREGNKSSSIGNRTVYKSDKYIGGFILPPYEKESTHLDLILQMIAGVDIDTLYKLKGATGVRDEMIRIVKEGY